MSALTKEVSLTVFPDLQLANRCQMLGAMPPPLLPEMGSSTAAVCALRQSREQEFGPACVLELALLAIVYERPHGELSQFT